MKPVTFMIAFILTACLVIGGVILFPVFRVAATVNNEFVFALFLGPFCVILSLSWLGEKLILKALKKH